MYQCCVTSLPADCQHDIVGIFAKVRRLLRDDGTVWLHVPASDDLLRAARIAFDLRDYGSWYFRSHIVLSYPARHWDSLLLFAKSRRYYYDQDAIRSAPTGRIERIKGFGRSPGQNDTNRCYLTDGLKGRNAPNVWHDLSADQRIAKCVAAGSRAGAPIIDPFNVGPVPTSDDTAVSCIHSNARDDC